MEYFAHFVIDWGTLNKTMEFGNLTKDKILFIFPSRLQSKTGRRPPLKQLRHCIKRQCRTVAMRMSLTEQELITTIPQLIYCLCIIIHITINDVFKVTNIISFSFTHCNFFLFDIFSSFALCNQLNYLVQHILFLDFFCPIQRST